VNLNHKRWNPDLINFDSSSAYGLPSYFVQQMFSLNRGDVALPITVESPTIRETPKGGAIGVGTWSTQAEFKDIRVTHDGETLFSSDFADGAKGWKMLSGDWKVQDGVLRQSSAASNVRAIAGDKSWTDYTYTLKARKLGGAEGFLILFRVQDEESKSWWNIGGWGNQRHAIEMASVIGNEVPGSIETGRWYDIRIEVKADRVKCFLDDKLIHDARQPSTKSLYASATRLEKTGEVILKVVNAASDELTTDVALEGVSHLSNLGKAIVLASTNSTDENSLAEPFKVAPVIKEIQIPGPNFQHTFPGNSVTVLRLPTQP
jgi:alpha-L-arabinofuranosidase